MKGFGVHTSMWTSGWTVAGAEHTVAAVKKYSLDFIEISLADPHSCDAAHTRKLLAANDLQAVCSLGLPRIRMGVPASAGGHRLSHGGHRQDGRPRRLRRFAA